AVDGDGREGLARVVDVRAGEVGEGLGEGGDEGAGAAAQVRLVEDVDGGAVLGGDVAHVDAAHLEAAVGGAGDRGRPRGAGVRGGRLGRRRRGAHMRSGAETPRRRRPLAMTWPVASLSHSRVRWTSSTGSSPRGETRLWSYQRW